MQVPAHAIGADHHDGADRIARRLQHVDRGRRRRAVGLGLLGQRLPGLDGDLAPVAVERRDQLAIGGLRPVAARCQLGPSAFFCDVGAGVFQPAEIARPGRVDAVRVRLVAGVELFDVVGVAAVEEGGEQELFVLFLSGHRCFRRGLRPAILLNGRRRPGDAVPFSMRAEYDRLALASLLRIGHSDDRLKPPSAALQLGAFSP